MSDDEIIEEVRSNRYAHAEKFNFNLRAIYEDLKKSELKHIEMGFEFIEPPLMPHTANKALQPTVTALRRFRSATQ